MLFGWLQNYLYGRSSAMQMTPRTWSLVFGRSCERHSFKPFLLITGAENYVSLVIHEKDTRRLLNRSVSALYFSIIVMGK
jgi:hypothetical protein